MRGDPQAQAYDNPSAGRFDPPAPAAPKAEPWNGTRIVIALLVLGVAVAEYWLRSIHSRGWLSLAAAVAALMLSLVHLALKQKHAHDRHDDTPYTQPNRVTR